MIQEYYNLFAGVHSNILTTVKDLALNSLGKDVINLYNKRLDSLNKRYETEKDLEVLKMIREEISEIYDRIEKESDKQRDWLKKLANGAMGTAGIVGSIAIGVKNKMLLKKIAETQAELLETAIEEWRKEELEKIKANPSQYIKQETTLAKKTV